MLVLRSDSLRQKGDLPHAIETLRGALAADTASAEARFHLAYALLAAEQVPQAIGLFRDGLQRDATFRDGFRQLGYLYSAAGKADSAFTAFLQAQKLGELSARDWVEVGYVQTARGNAVAAHDAFATALAAGDASVRELATAALAGSTTASTSPRPQRVETRRVGYAEAYAAPLYQTRFSNTIGQGFARIGLDGGSPSSVSPYVSFRLTRDSRSVGGARPEIFSDNSLIAAAGVKVQPSSAWPTLYAEAGPAFMLVDDGKGSRVRSDIRFGGSYFNGWYQSAALRTELYVDASYYARFDHDAITYLQMREIYDAWRPGLHAVELFARLGGVGDSRRVSYNNAIELAPGVAFVPGPTRRLVLTLEHVRGRYLVEAFTGQQPSYSDTRVMAVFYALAPFGSRTR